MVAEKIDVLDHGYVKLIETWGSDQRIIEAARMSTDKGFKGWAGDTCNCFSRPHLHCELDHEHFPECDTLSSPYPGCDDCGETGKLIRGDERLLRYLYTHKHMTPFEMAGMIVEVQAPIFVFREWHRHRTQSYNEMSARYVPLPDVNYMPTAARIMSDGGTNKQAQGSGALTAEDAMVFADTLRDTYHNLQVRYERAIRSGVPKELARLMLPVGRYSKMRASANLRNWLQFLALRMDNNAQWEIRQYAEAVASLVGSNFPRTYELFAGGRDASSEERG